MRKLLLLALTLMLTSPLQAEQVSVDVALQKAKQFARVNTRLKSQSTNNMNLAYTETTGMVNNFYVFNADNEGFVIVSADDCVTPVLGYSENGSFDLSNIPAGLKDMLEEYKNEINYAIENKFEKNKIVYATSEKSAIAPMIKTKWNQGDPYNRLCPTLPDGSQPATGCTATAFSQVMKFYEWPKKGQGMVDTEYIQDTPTGNPVDFSTTTYDWDNMLDVYSGSFTDAQANAVATLMHHAGAASKMKYGPSSGAAYNEAFRAFVENFNYDKSILYTHKKYYGINEFNDLVYNELSNNRPVMYAGYNTESGHAYVCDGYSSDNFFHINWGWGGMSDGYFKLSALDPSSQGMGGSSSGYNSGQEIIYNIKPDAGSTKYSFDFGYNGEFTTTTTSVTALEDVNVEFTHGDYITVYAPTSESFNLQIGVEVVNNATNKSTFYVGYYYKIYNGSFAIGNVSIPAKSLRELGDGEYTIYPAYNNVSWGISGHTKVPANGSKMVSMKISKGAITFTNEELEQPVITIEKLVAKSKLYLDSNMWLELTLHNAGADFSEPVYPMICSIVDNSYQIKQAGGGFTFDLPKDESATNDIKMYLDSNLIGEAGDYVLLFCNKEGEQYKILGGIAYNIHLEKLTEVTSVAIRSVDIKNSDAVDASNMELTVTAECMSGYFCNNLAAMIFNDPPQYSIGNIIKFVALEKGKSYTIPYEGGFDGVPGGKYILAMFAVLDGSYQQVSNAFQFTVGDVLGIEDVENAEQLMVFPNPAEDVVNITAPTNVNKVEVFSLDGKMVKGNNVVGSTNVKLNVEDLESGIYVLKVYAERQTHVARIIKK